MMLVTFWLGCTPLHWAALRGNVEACTVLAHAGSKEELLVKDKAGKTPVDLAFDKGHRHIALFLVCNSIGTCSWLTAIFVYHITCGQKMNFHLRRGKGSFFFS